MNTLTKMKKGRPNISESQKLERNFQKLYSRKIGAEVAAKTLNTDRKTAYKYYKKFSEQYQKVTIRNLFSEGMNRIKQQITSIDYLLLELSDSLDWINKEIMKKSDKPAPQFLMNQKIKIIREMNNLYDKKTSLELEIPINESVEEIVEEVLNNREKV